MRINILRSTDWVAARRLPVLLAATILWLTIGFGGASHSHGKVNLLSPAISPVSFPIAAPTPVPASNLAPNLPSVLPSPTPQTTNCVCSPGYTQTPPTSSPCACVVPIQVGLQLGIPFASVLVRDIELAKELAEGTFLEQQQVRITNVDAVGPNQEETNVLANLVPLYRNFDNTTVQLIAQRFWTKEVGINETLFGNYSVLFVKYDASPTVGPGGSHPGGTGGNGNPPPGIVFDTANRTLTGGIIAVIVISSTVIIVILVGALWLLGIRSRASESASVVEPPVKTIGGVGSGLSTTNLSFTPISYSSSFTGYNGPARTFLLVELEKATENFDPANVVGEGAFGRVFQGLLEDGTKVAVKVLAQESEQGTRQFLAEAELLSRLHHRNVVKLLGVCAEGGVRCLVYELVPNGNVETHLHDFDGDLIPMNWETRIKIALGAARGLAYLHEDASPRVIHRDFKASNILLEEDFTPKISDFGLAKVAAEGDSQHISTRVMGTFGYVAPEYAMTGHLLVKSDVYSYGVVLLELLSGKQPVDMNRPPGQENLVTWARPLLSNPEDLEELLDPALGHGVPFDNLARVAAIASMCVQPEVSNRPFMGEVVQALKLVYNDSENSEGRTSLNGSHMGELSSVTGIHSGGLLDHDSVYGLSSPASTYDAKSSPTQFSCDSDTVRPVSASAVLSTSNRFIRQLSGSFRRHSNSGPLRTTRSRPAWYRMRFPRGGTMSEHSNNHFEVGLERDYFELWP